MTAKIGPKEMQLQALRARNFERSEARTKAAVGTLREKVASIPARKAKAKKARR